MGKVFDALKRAEEQRAEHLGNAAVPAERPSESVAATGRTAKRARKPFWRRLVARPYPQEDAGVFNKRRISLLQPQSFVAEQFRTLRARIESLSAGRSMRTITVTSPNPGDGKTMTSVNLALVMSMGVGRKVCLVDCDLRRPTIHDSLGLRVDAGLAEVLRGVAEPEDALVQVEGSTLEVLPVRSIPPNPSELLASTRMRELVAKLSNRFDWVILDVPPVLGLPDAKYVTELCDGILLVVRADETPREDVESSLEILDANRMIGVVFNGGPTNADRYGYSS